MNEEERRMKNERKIYGDGGKIWKKNGVLGESNQGLSA